LEEGKHGDDEKEVVSSGRKREKSRSAKRREEYAKRAR